MNGRFPSGLFLSCLFRNDCAFAAFAGNFKALFRFYSFVTCRPFWSSLGDCHIFHQVCSRSLCLNSWPALSRPQVSIIALYFISGI